MKIIAIFDTSYELIGFLDSNYKFDSFEKNTELHFQKIQNIVSKLPNKKLLLRDGTGVSKEDSMYLDAVSEELKRNGYITKIIQHNIQPALISLYERFDASEMLDFMGDILNTETDDESAEELKALIDEIISDKNK